MALQLRRLISTSFLHRDFNNPSKIAPSMLQFTTVPNYPCTLFPGSPCSCSRKSGRGVHIRKLKSIQRCSARYNANFSLKKHWRYGSLCSSRQSCDFSSVIAGGNGYTLNFLAHELLSERSFSSDGSKIQLSVKANRIDDDVNNASTKHGDPNFIPQMLYGKKKKRNKLLAVFNGINGDLDIEVTNPSTIESSGKISQAVARTPEAIERGWNILKNGENKKKTTKSSGKIKDAAECELLKKATRAKKARVAGALQIAQHKSSEAVTVGAKIVNKEFRPLYPPFGRSVVVVESITKARVIQNYLGDMYEVLASFGHVRDLARRTGSVRPDDNFSMVWEVPSNAWTHLKSIKMALSSAENLILASDPDREGEAIAWHITEMLQQQDALPENITVARVVFHEITESSIKKALQAPREIDSNLVNAYLARRALDYLIGFSISPLLWRKLPGCQSAGRVQSAALALISDREMEIEQFNPQEYWTIGVDFNVTSSNTLERSILSSKLTHLNSKKLEQLSIISKEEGEAISMKVHSSNFKVIDLKRSKVRKNPPTPYITSTLQQDSANKLRFTTSYTMKLAQQLYEGIKLSDKEDTGLITYMRTDGMHISNEAAEDIHALIRERYGGEFTSNGVRKYFKKVKNAQEAHEAIRPTNIRRLPSTLAGILDADSLKLYTLIWSRAMACQMESVSIDMIQVDIGNKDRDLVFRSVGSRICFSGYEAVYKDREAGVDVSNYMEGDSNEAAFVVLHQLKVKDTLSLDKVDLNRHNTKPPSRYSEGALVKKLEELGIGRPSTYASIMKVLQDRNYVTMKNRVLHPEFRGRMVSEFLSHHFSEIADYSFTADMESELDNVSAGMTEWKGLLEDYWSRFNKCCNLASSAHIHQVEKMLEEKFNRVLFASLPNDSRLCPSCEEGTLRFKVSRFGSGYFIGCDQHPRCKFIAGTLFNDEDETVDPEKPKTAFPPRFLGCSPNSNEKVYLKNGPYGHYVQLGDDKTGSSPKRASISEGTNIDSITLVDALDLLQYPINLGNHPDDGHPVMLKHSKVGFSIKHRRTVSPVPRNMNPKTVTLQAGLKILKSKKAKQSGRPKRKPKSEVVEG